ncbi:hypothetical protein [Duganella qianjiadongensis]|uniref:Lipoprotein n=1 Tax=Duganella qianjiadongensis TaxID=2692176 RepID=A0ABW9VLR1_9BURK|nr:hypothetical protein [Duganella qianjiadongensis]MYM40543.1 hypothetical protein [Duganella qianjiadongensis]
MKSAIHPSLYRRAVLATLGLLGACSSAPQRPAVDWQHGAHHATIVSEYAADAGRSSLPPCLAALPADEYASHRYVKVHYHHVRLLHSSVAALPDGVAAGVGSEVEIWPADCHAGQLAHISRVLGREPAQHD